MTSFEIIKAPLCELGEAPVWDDKNQCLFWIDIVKKTIYCLYNSSQEVESMSLPFAPSAIIPNQSGGQLLVTKKGMALMDFDKKSYVSLPTPPINFSEEVFNDGKCDSYGRLWVDTRDFHTRDPKGHLYCFENDLSMRCIVSNLTIGNGLTWSVDESKFYLADSKPGSISVFDFDVEEGEISNPQIFIDYKNLFPARPDGITIDSENGIWVAEVDAGYIRRYESNGALHTSIKMPFKKPTSLIFGGPNLDILYVTSMRFGLTDEQLVESPLSGSLLAVKTGFKGLSNNQFNLKGFINA
jgi:sugar lactone lactonase YvrE